MYGHTPSIVKVVVEVQELKCIKTFIQKLVLDRILFKDERNLILYIYVLYIERLFVFIEKHLQVNVDQQRFFAAKQLNFTRKIKIKTCEGTAYK